MPTNQELDIFFQLEKEIQVNDKGVGFVSQRGLARMCGVSHGNWGVSAGVPNNVFFNYKVDEMLARKGFTTREQMFTPDDKVIDIVCSLIIKLYARENIIADQFLDAYLTIGIRSIFQRVKGWQPCKDYSQYMRESPRVWTKIFENDFYDQLSRLTGLSWDKKTHRRPGRFAYLTRWLVYDYLPKAVITSIKENRKAHGGYIHKIHQFLSEDGLKALQNHLILCLNILEGASNLQEAKRFVNQAITKQYQLTLF